MNHFILKPLTAAIMATALTGCLSSGSSSDGTGSLSLDVTDAPVDNLTEVNITFTGVSIQPEDGERIRIDFDEPKRLDLLELTRGNSASLLSDIEVPAGEYSFIRLHTSENESFPDMYVVEDNSSGTPGLTVPSGELKLVSGFTVPQGGSANFTIDFDMRKAIVDPAAENQSYKLRPALRLVNNVEVGSVEGTVLEAPNCSTTEFLGLVYVYEGADATPVDFYIDANGNDLREEQPLLAAEVVQGTGEDPNYKAAFLTEGEYTLAYTCDVDDVEADETLNFSETRNVTIVANETKTQDLPIPVQ
ncbi:MAG: DUF4382 domain-containing protein [Oleiphilaceae bacterium]|nr:DUF4382 domain-containing protein [Oleiphilaceae bacterium]